MEDCIPLEETYAKRLYRWKIIHASDIKKKKKMEGLDEGNSDGNDVTNASISAFSGPTQENSNTTEVDGQDDDCSRTAIMSGREIQISNLGADDYNGRDNKNSNRIPPSTLVSLRSHKQLLNRKYQGVCLVCQNSYVRIMYNPCQHGVLCLACFQAGHCRKFCPICRVPVQSVSQPNLIKIIRPRIYSPYSFM